MKTAAGSGMIFELAQTTNQDILRIDALLAKM